MIKEIRVEHWKSFDQATLYIDPLTILIGPNASGKSNLIEALAFLQRVAAGVYVDEALNGNGVLPPLRGGAAAACRAPSPCFALTVTVGASGEPDCRWRLRGWCDGRALVAFAEELSLVKPGAGSAVAEEGRLLWTDPPPDAEALGPCDVPDPLLGTIKVHRSLRGQSQLVHWGNGEQSATVAGRAQSYLHVLAPGGFDPRLLDTIERVRTTLSQVFVYDPVPSAMRGSTPLSDRLKPDGSNLAGVLAALGQEDKGRVEARLTQLLKGLPERDIEQVWAEPVGPQGLDAMLYFKEGWLCKDTPPIDARLMSDGTLRFLAITAAMLLQPEGSLLVVEEVDNGLHPSRARLLLDMLRTLARERGIDVLVTTHNPALLDAAGAPMLPYIAVAHRDAATGASRLSQLEELDALPKLLAVGSIGQLSTAGRIEAALAVGGA